MCRRAGEQPCECGLGACLSWICSVVRGEGQARADNLGEVASRLGKWEPPLADSMRHGRDSPARFGPRQGRTQAVGRKSPGFLPCGKVTPPAERAKGRSGAGRIGLRHSAIRNRWVLRRGRRRCPTIRGGEDGCTARKRGRGRMAVAAPQSRVKFFAPWLRGRKGKTNGASDAEAAPPTHTREAVCSVRPR